MFLLSDFRLESLKPPHMPIFRQTGSKTPPFVTAHTFIAYIRESPPPCCPSPLPPFQLHTPWELYMDCTSCKFGIFFFFFKSCIFVSKAWMLKFLGNNNYCYLHAYLVNSWFLGSVFSHLSVVILQNLQNPHITTTGK